MFVQSNEELNKIYLNLFSKIWELQKEAEDNYNGNK